MKWEAVTPPCLQSLRESHEYIVLSGTLPRNATLIMPALADAYPDIEQRILVLLGWYGQGYGTWTDYPSCETEAEYMLNQFSSDLVTAVIEKHTLTRTQLEGAARCFVTSGRVRSKDEGWVGHGIKVNSKTVRQKLLAYCLSTNNHEKIVLGRRAFDDTLMQQLTDIASNEGVVNLVAAHQRFSFKLFRQISLTENGCISPLSVELALALIYNGAGGETRAALARALECQNLLSTDFNHAHRLLTLMLTTLDTSFQLVIANALWARLGITFEARFMEDNREFYNAEMSQLDFADASAVNVVNQWVAKQTSGKISSIATQIDPLSVMLLMNTVYFEANWSYVFNQADTQEGFFTTSNGTQKHVPMMRKFAYYGYFAGDSVESIRLPYGEGHVSMYIFLPDTSTPFQTFQQNLTVDQWTEWLARYQYQHGTIIMPRFKFGFDCDLTTGLKALGLANLFDLARADFQGICSSVAPFWLNEVQHKTFLQVDEDGTKAAAVTWTFFAGGMPSESFRMVVDRPFFFAIRDDRAGAILFMGTVVDPVW